MLHEYSPPFIMSLRQRHRSLRSRSR
jgi:hypothetical protein